MDNTFLKEELIWFIGLLAAFISLLIIIEPPKLLEIVIIILSYSLNWLIVRYLIKKIGSTEIKDDSLKQEIVWFGGILIIFLSTLVIIGNPSSSDLVIIIVVYSFIWVIRSYLVKRFASSTKTNLTSG